MKTNIQTLRKQRVFSEEFKRDVVQQYERGQYSIYQLGRLYSIATPVLYRWVYKFSTFNEKGSRIVEMKSSSQCKLKELETRIRELEQMVGQKQIKIEYLEKMIDLAKDELNIDIKKNSNTPPSGGSGKTLKK
jgi:transposase